MTFDLPPERGPVRYIIISIKELGSVLIQLLTSRSFYERSGPRVVLYMLRYT